MSLPLELPLGHKLLRWKVLNGSPVRKGETVALAIAAGSETTVGPTNPLPVAPKHKRPTRRKRPVAKKPSESCMPVAPPPTVTTNTANSKPTAAATDIDGSIIKERILATGKPNQGTPEAAFSTTPSSTKEVPILAPTDGIVRHATAASTPTIIGYVEDCPHPTIVGNMCAVCGMTIAQFSSNKPASNNPAETEQMSRMTVSGGLTVSVSQAEGQRIAQQDADRLHTQRKLSLVLDLDHTLVHATDDVRAVQFQHHTSVRSIVLPVWQQQQQQTPAAALWYNRHFVKLRPFVNEFLHTAVDTYELGVYTAGTREYAEQIILLLAREWVGAQMDQVELEELRCRVRNMEGELQKMKETTAASETAEKTASEPMDVDTKVASLPEETVAKEAEKDEATDSEIDATVVPSEAKVEASPAGKKRKRVEFSTEPPQVAPPPKEVELTYEMMAVLRAELEAAEELERQAVEMRTKLFGGRVVSRTDVGDLGRDVKSLKRIFPCGGTMAAVVDDREDVWANAEEIFSTRRGEPPDNLLLVRPYQWKSFQGFADVNNKSGFDLSKLDAAKIDSESDEQLRWTGAILKELHKRYYERLDAGNRTIVPKILAEMRSEVLRGCHVVLSGLVPLQQQKLQAGDPRPAHVRYVQSMGGTLLPVVENTITHVVAVKDGTDKILAARRVQGCRIVSLAWLMECFWSMSKRDESNHWLAPGRQPPLTPTTVRRLDAVQRDAVQPLVKSTKENSSTESDSSDEDDDDFLNDLTAELVQAPKSNVPSP